MNSSNKPDPSPPTASSHSAELEQTLTFQQRSLDELNEVVLRQQGEIDQLRREVRQLRGDVERAVELASAELPPDEKPPHY